MIEIGHARGNSRASLCKCTCGTQRTVHNYALVSGKSKSCGCYNLEKVVERATRHGYAMHPIGKKWYAMMGRCYDPTANQYKDWGGRGIEVCPQWHNIATFVRWVEKNLGPCPDGMSLDRIDNDGNYEPGNIRWATHYEQTHNRRSR